jgi:hypothetical protein
MASVPVIGRIVGKRPDLTVKDRPGPVWQLLLLMRELATHQLPGHAHPRGFSCPTTRRCPKGGGLP